jgi:LPXTG-site transpeptidase (sortase) family protein
MHSRAALIGLVAGLGLVLAAAVLWVTGAGADPAPVAAPAAAATAFRAPVPVAAEAPDKLDLEQAVPPVRVRVDAIDVNADVVPVGVDDRGEMGVPEDVRKIGWYRFGPGPGAAEGAAVLAGHVDDRVQGPGAFVVLGELAEGDAVAVDLADGTTLRYGVRSVEEIGKDELPVERLFDRSGPPRLTLVTCGGAFDPVAREHQNNVVVTAEPVVG